MKEIKVLKFNPKEKVKEEQIENTLEGIQKAVGGYFESIPIDNKFILICNEEGKIKNLENNVCLVRLKEIKILDTIKGSCFITKRRGENFSSLSKEDLKELKKRIDFDEDSKLSVLFV